MILSGVPSRNKPRPFISPLPYMVILWDFFTGNLRIFSKAHKFPKKDS